MGNDSRVVVGVPDLRGSLIAPLEKHRKATDARKRGDIDDTVERLEESLFGPEATAYTSFPINKETDTCDIRENPEETIRKHAVLR